MPNGQKYMYQHLPLQDPPKLTQIGIFGLKKKTSGNAERDQKCRGKYPN
jgi:hypothetical protein